MDSRDSRYCSGDTGSSQCRCHRFVQRPGTDNCTCEHPEGYHPDPMPHTAAGTTSAPIVPTPSTASIVASYLAPSTILKGKAKPILSSSSNRPPVASSSKNRPKASKPSVSHADALAETHAGMKRKADRLENAEAKPPKRSKKEKQVAMGEVILIVIAGDKERKNFVTPTMHTIAYYESRHLSVNGIRDAMHFNLEWDDYQMDIWFRELFPDYFTYADRYYPLDPKAIPPEFHWRQLIRDNKKLSASPNPADGHEFKRYLGSTPDQRKIFIASRWEIPGSVWDHETGWVLDIPPEVAEESESDVYAMEEDSDEESWSASGNDSDSRVPTRPSAKSLGKAKAKSLSDYFPMVTLPPAIAPAVALPVASTLPTGGAVTAPAPAVLQIPATATAPQPAAVAITGPQPHPSLLTVPSPPSSPRASRYSNYSMYSTFTSKHFMMWDSGDFEVDPHFWTRPHEIDSVMDT
ncbi:hypothetical protein C8R47DRAFT_1082034 [Mycena vitilis]|nr:hypothetical protein C8R47DRAFT_1082034 [Mycena vitilis]